MSTERKQFAMNPLLPPIQKRLGVEDNFVEELRKREAEWERKWNMAFPKLEAQAIWKERFHEERLNKRLGIERLKLISVLSQMLEKKQKGIPAPPPTKPAAAAPQIHVINPRNERPNEFRQIKEMAKKHPGKTIAGVIGTGLAVAAIIFAARSCDSSPTVGPESSPTPIAGTPTPRPTEIPTLIPTPKPTATAVPTETNIEPREERLKTLDDIFRKKGVEAWLKAAGFEFKSLKLSARQPEEEILNGRIVATGFQVEVEGLNANYPAGLTTDQPVNDICVKPDPNNPSKVCTNVRDFTGRATLYVDLQNWGQFSQFAHKK